MRHQEAATMRRAVGLSMLLAAFGAPPAGAQTSDVLFGGWSWRSREVGSRPAGLGGAYVAVADSIRTTTVNPAGVALIPRAELSLSSANLWGGAGLSLRRTVKPADEPAKPTPAPAERATTLFDQLNAATSSERKVKVVLKQPNA